jgi:hypothetical protein
MGIISENVKTMVAFQKSQRAAKENSRGGYFCEKHPRAYLQAHMGTSGEITYRCPLCFQPHEIDFQEGVAPKDRYAKQMEDDTCV